MSVGIAYVDGPRLARSLFAAADWVAAGRDEINRINVFPVPDGDTGTNFSLTLRSVADALRALGDAPLPETANTMARAAVLGARGNSGMMLAHFLLGFAEALGDRKTATATDVAAAVRRGSDRLYESLDDPREGTILTVAREAAAAAERAAAESADVGEFMRRLLEEGEIALARTPELLAVLKEAGVVDAGGKGFVRMLEGVVRYIEGDPILPVADSGVDFVAAIPAAQIEVAAERDFQYCTEVLVRGEHLPAANEVRSAMHLFGGSVVVAVMADILKIHVHTDSPEAVFSYATRWGRVETTKADDMRVQHRRLSHTERRPVAVVTDSSADLADQVLDRHRIALVPLQVVFGDRTFRDRVELKPEEFYRRMREARDLPTTSQPTPADFVRVLRDARAEADEVVAVLLASALSGTFASAQAAVKAAGLTGVRLVDSRSASLGVGMLALRGAELAESGWPGAAIAGELERLRAQCRHAAHRRPVRQSAPVGPGVSGEGVDRRDAGREADPLARRRREGDSAGPGARTGEPDSPGAGPAGEAAHAAAPRGPIRSGPCRGAGDRRAGTHRIGGGLPATGLFRHPGHRGARDSRGRRSLGHILSSRGWHPRPPRRHCRGGTGMRIHAGKERPVTTPPEALRLALDAIQDLKGNQLVVLDLRGLTDATDYFVIASGTSDAHVRGIAESVIEKLDRRGHHTHHVEGLTSGRWVLLDFVDFVIHLFHPETRSFYQLERLWDDAPELLIGST